MVDLDPAEYRTRYGPGESDRIHLADTGLVAEVSESLIPPGEESLIGAGKNLREGMHVHRGRHAGGLDAVITNAVVLDPILGVLKADIGVRDGLIAGVGNAGNPDVMEVTEGMVIDSRTSVVQGKGLLATPGGIDAHQHYKSPGVLDAALQSGITSVIMMGHAPNYEARTNPGFLEDAIRAAEATPVNIGFLGQGSDSDPESVSRAIEAGMCGLKVHEDHAAYPAVVDAALEAAERHDVQVSIHTDSINESGHLETTLDAIDGRSIHAFHIEGAGGGHIPDLLEFVSEDHVLPSSTNPTIPHTRGGEKELLNMILPVHQMEGDIPEDRSFAEGRIRGSTMAAEERLHELGAIPMTNSDSMGMGRAYETVLATWQTASKTKQLVAGEGTDNERIRRYLAKYTVNPAIVQGIEEYVGSLRPGRMADLVLWRPAFFGVKPERVIKGGAVVAAAIGTENGTTTTGQPVRLRESVGSVGEAPGALSLLFTSGHAIRKRSSDGFGTTRLPVPVSGTRNVTRADMVSNTATPDVSVDTGSHEVRIDGELVEAQPLETAPLAQRYFLH